MVKRMCPGVAIHLQAHMSAQLPLLSTWYGKKSLALGSEILGSDPASTTYQLSDLDQILQPFESQREQKTQNERSLMKLRSHSSIP